MKFLNLIIIAVLTIAAATITTSCWTDLEQYDEFTCERFGGDGDNDGVCSRFDCNDADPDIYPGAPCDDDDEETLNDAYNDECDCVGE